MAAPDSTPTGTAYPAKSYLLRGSAQNVAHKTEGTAAVSRPAIVLIEKTTFMDRGATRQVSTATVVFLENVGVDLSDTVTLPDEVAARTVLKVTVSLGEAGVIGYLTTVFLGEVSA